MTFSISVLNCGMPNQRRHRVTVFFMSPFRGRFVGPEFRTYEAACEHLRRIKPRSR